MYAWRFHETGKPLVYEEVDVRHPGPGEVLVNVKACGLCHTDVSAMKDPSFMALFPTLPHTLGHESSGVIAEVGEGMEHWKVGERVSVICLMPDGDGIGFGKWEGAFGPYIRATEPNLAKLPDDVPFDMGALATDAGVTAYRAMVTIGGVQPGMKVGVIGLGGIGYCAARFAVLAGAEVYGSARKASTRALGAEIGLTDVADRMNRFKGLDLVVDCAGNQTTQSGLEALRHSGTLVQVGMYNTQVTFETLTLVNLEQVIKGSMSGTREEIEKVFEYMRSGQLNPPMQRISVAEIPDGLDLVEKGGLTARIVAVYDD